MLGRTLGRMSTNARENQGEWRGVWWGVERGDAAPVALGQTVPPDMNRERQLAIGLFQAGVIDAAELAVSLRFAGRCAASATCAESQTRRFSEGQATVG
jgi:hypothetical protein